MTLIIRKGEDEYERHEMDGFRFVPLISES